MQKRLGLDLEVPDEFGIGLAWFSAGEAHFGARIQRRTRDGYSLLYLTFTISLRADDRPGLEHIQNSLGVGEIYVKKGGTSKRHPNPMVSYEVKRIADLYHVIVPLFEKYPIPAHFKKARDFEIWKKIIEIHYHEGGPQPLGFAPGGKSLGGAPLSQSYWDNVEPLVDQLKASREFRSEGF